MPHALSARPEEGSVKDLRLFRKALLEGPMRCDSTILKIAYGSSGTMAYGDLLRQHEGKLAPNAGQGDKSISDPKGCVVGIAQGMLNVKFDITSDVMGTGSPFLILKTDGDSSAIGLHCICESSEGRMGVASMILRTGPANIEEAYGAITKDPTFGAALPLAIFPLTQDGFALSMKGSIAVLYDGKHCEIIIR